MRSWSRTGILSLLVLVVSVVEAFAYEVTIRRGIEYVEHDGVKLHGDLYHPVSRERTRLPIVPVVIAVHGGGWRSGTPDYLQALGSLSCGSRLRGFRDRVPAVEARPENLSGRGL